MKIIEFRDITKFKFQPNDEDTNAVRIRELEYLAPYLPNWGLNVELGVFNGVTISTLAKDMGGKNVKADAFNRDGKLPDVPDNVQLYKGWFNETLEPFLGEKLSPISFLHVDCDLYSSTDYALNLLNDYIMRGTIIRFDELCCWRHVFKEASPKGKSNRVMYTTWKDHEWKALNEWLEKYDRKVMPISRNWFQGATVIVTQ
jgi:hypothetical protein